MERIRLGNNIAISWALYDLNGRIHSLENKEVQLYMSCGGLKQAVTDYTIQGNVVSWVFLGTEQKKVGLYKLILVETDALSGAQVVDVAEAFRLVSETLSAVETGEVTKNVSVRSVLTYSNLVGVESVDVVESSEDGGTNLVSIRLVDGNVVEIPIKNGSKGDTGATGATGATGPKGDKGDIGERGPAGIDSVEAAIGTNDPTQAPSVDKDLSEGVLSLTFNNIKGEKGDKGDQGNTGSSVDYPYELVNNVTTDDATKGLSAAQGVVLDGKISQLGQELPLNLINKGVVSEWDVNSSVTNRFVSLIQGHIYKFAIKFQNSGGPLSETVNVKLMTGISLSSVKRIINLANTSITAGDIVTAELLWSDESVENYRLGIYAPTTTDESVCNGAEISVIDITIDSVPTITKRLITVAPIGFISTHATDKIAITDTTITIPENTRIVYGLNGYSYTATQESATIINRDSNYEQLIVFNIGTKAIVSRMIDAVQTDDVILFMVQNTTDKRKISLHPSLYTYDGKSPFAMEGDISKAVDDIRTDINSSYPTKKGKISHIEAGVHTYLITNVELIKGHKYKATIYPDSSFVAPNDFNLKVVANNSDTTIYRIATLGGTAINTESFEFLWQEDSEEIYRIGFYADDNVNTAIKVSIQDITIDSVSGISWDVISRNKHKAASLVSAVSHRGNDAIKVADKLSLLHFSDVHGNTANIADVVEYMTHYADFLDDAIHTGDSVEVQYSNPNPFISVEGAGTILNVIGNHEAWLNTSDPDYYATEKQTYDKIFAPSIADWDVVQPTGAAQNGYCYYYKDYSPAGFRLIVLDSVHWHYRNGVTDSNPTQKAWFESVLADARTNNLRVVCAMHYPPQNGIIPVANDTGWNAPILSDSGGLVGDGWYAADEIFDCVDAFITAGGKFNGWIMGHTHEDFFGKVLGHTEQPIVVIGTANGSGYIYDKFVSGTVAQDNFNIITFENLDSKDYIKIVKIGGDCDVLMRSKKTICYNVTDGIIVSTT